MKPFECSVCGKKAAITEADVRWHYEPSSGRAAFLHISHNNYPCNEKGEGCFFNRALPMEYVWKHMPEFIAYIKRLEVKEKELKEFVKLVEKDRSYIRRHTVDKKEVKKLIIRLEGSGRCAL
ncbi:MAG TPA: hypothetical protein P5511_03265 [Candidatus Goldiibacteriota bacterium]|mgnify:CR=1 FL=1|nr:hypothetical protein [Candidatus Goldiibacteriota bacterium]